MKDNDGVKLCCGAVVDGCGHIEQHAFFIGTAIFLPRLKCCLAKVQFSEKVPYPLPDKKVFKMIFGMSTIILKCCISPDLIIFRYSCFKIGQSEPRVAYKRKSVYQVIHLFCW